MSSYGSFLSDEQFQCPICLEVFTNPSTTPCGHSFCMSCITRHWNGGKACQCPLCKHSFEKPPSLQINRTLREITEQFKSTTGWLKQWRTSARRRDGKAGKGGGGGGGGDAEWDMLEELEMRLPKPSPSIPVQLPGSSAQRSLAPGQGVSLPTSLPIMAATSPMASSVPEHSLTAALREDPMSKSVLLPPPPPSSRTASSRRRFTVCGTAQNNNLPICAAHQRGLLMFCRTDGICICAECKMLDHHDHDTVSIETEWMNMKGKLCQLEEEIQDMTRQRVRKTEEVRKAMKDLQMCIEHETAGSMRLFSSLVRGVEHAQAELLDVMEMSQRAAQHQADAAIHQLEQEVAELRGRGKAMAKLIQSDDCVHGIQTYPALATHPPTTDWTNAAVNTDLGTAIIYWSLASLVERFQEELRGIAENGFPVPTEPSPLNPQPRALGLQQYAVDVTLDSSTAHPKLILSEDRKKVKYGERPQQLPDNPERFDRVICVLGRESFSSGRHYWEVEVGGKTDWDLGVASQSTRRKGLIEVTPSKGYWFLSLREKSKHSLFSSSSSSSNPKPHRIGVFVDYEKGQVSFYNVDTKCRIYTFSDTFTENIYPFFSPCANKSGKNSEPLIITPLNFIKSLEEESH